MISRINKTVVTTFRYILLLALILLTVSSFSQTYPQNYFTNPLSSPLVISGNFGEPRANHFHTGIDFTTRKQINLKVLASASGYISRIRVSPFGYGKAIYITHPNGYMTVYAHLDHFTTDIQQYVRKKQYAKESFEVDLYPEKNLFQVKQGEVIAYSGNSGGSSAPHLHFEIRDAGGETYPLNPLAFGIKVQDNLSPKIQSLAFYPLDLCCGLRGPVIYKVNQGTVTPDTIISRFSKFGLGVQAGDWMNGSDSDGDFGIYSLELQLDGKSIFSFQNDRLDFAEGRYANCMIDYAQKKINKREIYRAFLLPGNQAGVYKDVLNRGMIELNDSIVHKATVTAKDFFGNTAAVTFYIKYSATENPAPSVSYQKIFDWQQPNSFTDDSIQLDFPAKCFYDDYYFNYLKENNSGKNIFSSVYTCGSSLTPLHKAFTIKILPRKIPDNLKSKALIVQKDNNTVSGKTSEWEGNYLVTLSIEMGKYQVMIDTVASVIQSLNGKVNLHQAGTNIRFKISDNLSGIAKYNGYLDGKWALMEYDAKNKLLTYTVENNLPKGEHTLKVIVEDGVKNKSSYSYKFKL